VGCGMGGYGSGRRRNKKDTTEGYLCLDINTFRKRGRWKFLSGVSTWWRGDVKRAAVSYVIMDHEAVLYWRNRFGESFQQRVPLASADMNYGRRYFFLCPSCQRRVTKLYAGIHFYCRHCYNLTYESCQKSHDHFCGLLGLSDKEYRNFFKTIEYSRDLQGRKRVGARMLRRLNRYMEKSNVRF
jgi:hypothetical protein